MMIPDRAIVRKIQEYDPYLYVEWNSQKQYFEVWRKCAVGRKLITPVTRSIYFKGAPIDFVQLDERIIWWLHAADSWRYKSSKEYAMTHDSRWQDFIKNQDKSRRSEFYDRAKDAYTLMNANYVTKHASKNGKPKFNTAQPKNTWVRPDAQSKSNPRAWSRSKENALKYGFRK